MQCWYSKNAHFGSPATGTGSYVRKEPSNENQNLSGESPPAENVITAHIDASAFSRSACGTGHTGSSALITQQSQHVW